MIQCESETPQMGSLSADAKEGDCATTCGFCGATFASKGTYGRHLDSKRGDSKHPQVQIDQIRANVVRRGPNRLKERVEKAKQSKSILARAYNSKEAIREKNKLRRKERDMRIKARLNATDWLLSAIEGSTNTQSDFATQPKFSTQPQFSSFSTAVAVLLSPRSWPVFGTVPGETEFKKLLAVLSLAERPLQERLFLKYGEWKKMEEKCKHELWQKDVDQALRNYMGQFSIWELSHASEVLLRKQAELYENYTQGEVLDWMVSEEDQ